MIIVPLPSFVNTSARMASDAEFPKPGARSARRQPAPNARPRSSAAFRFGSRLRLEFLELREIDQRQEAARVLRIREQARRFQDEEQFLRA